MTAVTNGCSMVNGGLANDWQTMQMSPSSFKCRWRLSGRRREHRRWRHRGGLQVTASWLSRLTSKTRVDPRWHRDGAERSILDDVGLQIDVLHKDKQSSSARLSSPLDSISSILPLLAFCSNNRLHCVDLLSHLGPVSAIFWSIFWSIFGPHFLNGSRLDSSSCCPKPPSSIHRF